MEAELFILKMAETDECQKIMYKRLSIHMLMGLYLTSKPERGTIDPFMIPFRDLIKKHIETEALDIDNLIKYMIDNDRSNCAIFIATTLFTPKKGLSSIAYFSAIAEHKILTPFVDTIDLDIVALMVVTFIFDNLHPNTITINEIIGNEQFMYATNQYNLTKVNGAIFKKDGLIFDGKGYYYNYFTNKSMLDPYDNMVGFARIINDNTKDCDIFYRLDERLSMLESEYNDYTGVAFAKFRGPQFNFSKNNLTGQKNIIVHFDTNTLDKLLMVIKQDRNQNTGEEFFHIELETLPYKKIVPKNVITTFLHGIYYPKIEKFTHIDYAKNEYEGFIYSQKYTDSQNGLPIDQYTATRDLHYKIWCIENGEFSKETWYKLMIISLPPIYQQLLNEMLA